MAIPVPSAGVTQKTGAGQATSLTVAFTTSATEDYMIVRIALRGTGPATVSSVVFNGTSNLTKLKEDTSTTGSIEASIWGGTVPTGTTGNVVATFGLGRAAMGVNAYTGVVSVGTAVSDIKTTGTTSSVTLTGVEAARCVSTVSTCAGDNNPVAGDGQTAEFTRVADDAAQVEIDGFGVDEASTISLSGLNHANGASIYIGVPLVGTPISTGKAAPYITRLHKHALGI